MKLRIAAIIVTGFAFGGVSIGTHAARLSNSADPALQQQSESQSQTQGTQQDSVAEAARKAREKAKAEGPVKKTFTNDTLANMGSNHVSVMSNPTPAKDVAADQAKAAAATEPKKDETYWRKRFADARAKLATAEKELDISQRELNLLQTQYYADPNKALQQQLTRDDINKKTAYVDEKKQQVADLTQAIEDLKDEMRHAGGEPGWAN
jgi:hypothetical protein